MNIKEKILRRILALALIHPTQVRRAFSLIIDVSPLNIQDFLMYFCEVYIGFTQIELQIGANAFAPGINIRHRSSTINSANNSSLFFFFFNFIRIENFLAVDHDYANAQNQTVRFGLPSPQPSTPSMPTTTITEEVVHRWEMDIAKPPQYQIDFWNVHWRAANAIARTNNSMEANHQQFQVLIGEKKTKFSVGF